jgi:NADPH-dependent F420 reductase
MGRALARQLAKQNVVIIGSRDAAKAEAAAQGLRGVAGSDNRTAAREADVVIFAIPYEAMDLVAGIEGEVSGKLVISLINPMKSEGGLLRYSVAEGSAAEELARMLPRSRVATAFNNVPAGFLKDDVVPPVDILIAADSKETFEGTAELVRGIREMRPLYAGPLSQARIVEEITPLVLNLANFNGTKALTTRFVARKG